MGIIRIYDKISKEAAPDLLNENTKLKYFFITEKWYLHILGDLHSFVDKGYISKKDDGYYNFLDMKMVCYDLKDSKLTKDRILKSNIIIHHGKEVWNNFINYRY